MTKITLRSDKLPSSRIQIPIFQLSNNLYTLPNNILISHDPFSRVDKKH